ncbi:methionine ABC transporter ATP-binding protein [Kyrpidia spormannii]|uniref:Methionine ABC transporter ATP-binding protein n=1 Tax=Kyrpidia spormannii TaxID=2055160 RepID=A0A2K8N886_9BACL|nr:ATP-binding cassette domain-containing protein [Kyrpidia spormannii]ATY84642.1 methionine ABC transporter ATP-binding protein [Kyrpidia spormannii]
MIELDGVSKDFTIGGRAVRVLDGIDLNIPKGTIYGIIGHSGAGKSTLVRCINLLERPTSGRVTVNGKDLTNLDPRKLQSERQKIGMVFQHFNLLSSRTAAENIEFPLELAGWPKERRRRRVEELLRLVGLWELRDQYPSKLSGGQKQRVGIARALAPQPEVLLCDEATSALDPQTTDSILELLASINRSLGLTMVVITHEMHVVTAICDRVAVLHQGRIVEEGRVVDVFLRPKHPVTTEFVRQMGGADTDDLPGVPQDEQLLRCLFVGDSALRPVFSEVTEETGVHVRILQGSVDRMKTIPYGRFIVALVGPEEAKQRAIQILQDRGAWVKEVNSGGSGAMG